MNEEGQLPSSEGRGLLVEQDKKKQLIELLEKYKSQALELEKLLKAFNETRLTLQEICQKKTEEEKIND